MELDFKSLFYLLFVFVLLLVKLFAENLNAGLSGKVQHDFL